MRCKGRKREGEWGLEVMVWRETLSRNTREGKQKVAEYKINDMSGQSRHAAVPKTSLGTAGHQIT